MIRKKGINITYDYYIENKNTRNIQNKPNFYYISDIKRSLINYNIKHDKTTKKKDLELLLFSYFEKINTYEKHIDKIKKIQLFFRKKNNKQKIKNQGIGILNKDLCQNKEDFYTFENIYDISDVYFFSYEDNGFIYFFDIRSFNKLLKHDKLNPYTRENIPNYAINAFKNRINVLNNKNISIKFEPCKELTKEQKFKNKVIQTLQTIDSLNVVAGGIPYESYNKLSIVQLKMFYRVLEDIWNYRADLPLNKKLEIVPQNNMFYYSVHEVMSLKNKYHVEKIVLNEINKLITSSPSKTHRSTGCYYVLIALVEISPEFSEAFPWLVQYN